MAPKNNHFQATSWNGPVIPEIVVVAGIEPNSRHDANVDPLRLKQRHTQFFNFLCNELDLVRRSFSTSVVLALVVATTSI